MSHKNNIEVPNIKKIRRAYMLTSFEQFSSANYEIVTYTAYNIILTLAEINLKQTKDGFYETVKNPRRKIIIH